MQAPRRQSNFLACVNDCVTETYQSMRWFLEWYQQERGHWGTLVLDNFCCGISVILISNCGITVFSEPVGCFFLAFWMVLKLSSNVFQAFSGFRFLLQSRIEHSRWNLSLVVTVNWNSLRRNRKRVCYFFFNDLPTRQWMLPEAYASDVTYFV